MVPAGCKPALPKVFKGFFNYFMEQVKILCQHVNKLDLGNGLL